MDDLIRMLDECLLLLEEGAATPDECLARYPERADELYPLLEIALEVRRVPQPAPSPTAFAAGRRRMLETLAEKKRRQAVSPRPLRRYAEGLAALLGMRERRAPALQLALAAALALVLLTVGGLYLLPHLGRAVAQAATLTETNGVVEILPAGSDTWQPASTGERVEAGDRIRTGPLSTGTLVFFDGSVTRLEAGTE
ncbi:MAG TPA: hypothetical protein ENI39_03455, partial [Anaerolineae bacterium]|nr:hypothetical protein [Anaerolineae bacterium]